MPALRSLLRIGRRSATKSPLRSLLIVLVIALLVATGSAFSALVGSTQVTDEDYRRSTMGDAAAALSFQSHDFRFFDEARPVEVVPGSAWDTETEAAMEADAREWYSDFDFDSAVEQVAAALGTEVGATRTVNFDLASELAPFGERRTFSTFTDIGRYDLVAAGNLDLVAGRPPQADDEVALSVRDARRLGLEVGAIVTHPDRDRTVVGLVVDPAAGYRSTNLVTSPAWDSITTSRDGGNTSFNLYLNSMPAVRDRTEAQLTVEEIVGRPVAGSFGGDFFYSQAIYGGGSSERFIPILLMVLLAAQVALVVAAAFAVAVRRRTREFGQLAATGADGSQLRKLLIVEGLVLGCVGAALGLIGGLLLTRSSLVLDLFQDGERYVSSARYEWVDIVIPGLVGIGAAVVAAWWPARMIANAPVTATLSDHLPTRPVGQATAKWGLVVLAVGLFAFLALSFELTQSDGSSDTILLLAASVLAILGGAVMLVGPILAFIGRRANSFPLLARLVARNSDRQRSRSWVVVGAFIATMAIPVIFGASIKAYPTSWTGGVEEPLDGQLVSLRTASRWLDPEVVEVDPADLAAFSHELGGAIESIVGPIETTTLVDVPGFSVSTRDGRNSWGGVTLLVATPEIVSLLELSDDVVRKLDDATVVNLSSSLAIPSRIALSKNLGYTVVSPGIYANDPPLVVDVARGPAMFDSLLLVNGDLASELETEPREAGTIFKADAPVSDEQEEEIRRAANDAWAATAAGLEPAEVEGASRQLQLAVERSSSGPSATQGRIWSLGVTAAIAALIAFITASLAAVELDRELKSMVAVGAKPTMRRLMLGAQTYYHLVIAAVIGIPLAIVIFWAGAQADENGPTGLVVPWSSVFVMGIIVPIVVAGLVALVFRNAKPAVSRRLS